MYPTLTGSKQRPTIIHYRRFGLSAVVQRMEGGSSWLGLFFK